MRTEGDTASTRIGVKDGCGPSCGCSELDLSPQQEQPRALDCQDISPTPRDSFPNFLQLWISILSWLIDSVNSTHCTIVSYYHLKKKNKVSRSEQTIKVTWLTWKTHPVSSSFSLFSQPIRKLESPAEDRCTRIRTSGCKNQRSCGLRLSWP